MEFTYWHFPWWQNPCPEQSHGHSSPKYTLSRAQILFPCSGCVRSQRIRVAEDLKYSQQQSCSYVFRFSIWIGYPDKIAWRLRKHQQYCGQYMSMSAKFQMTVLMMLTDIQQDYFKHDLELKHQQWCNYFLTRTSVRSTQFHSTGSRVSSTGQL